MAISDRRNYSPKSDDSRDMRRRHRSRSPSYRRYSPEIIRRRNPSRSRSPPPPPPPPDDSRDIRRRYRSRSPSYARYSPELSRHRNPSRSRTPPLPPPPPPYRKPLPVRDNYNNRRERGNYGRVPDNESDEELRGLSFEEYRRLKRQKLRRDSRHCIWRVTPSPPRSKNDAFRDDFDGNLDDDDINDAIPSKSRSGSGSESESGSDSRLKSRGKKSARVRDKKSESDLDSDTDSKSGSEDSDSGSRKRSKKRRNKRKKSSTSRRKSSRKSSDSEEDEESEDGDDSSEKDRKKRKSKSKRGSSGRRKKSSRRKSRESETEDESEGEGERRRKRNKKKKKKVVRESSEEGSDSGEGKSELEIDETLMKIDEMGDVDDGEVNPEVLKFKEMLEAEKMAAAMVNEPLVGPQPLPKAEGHISYGGALRPGEGDAIAQYVQQGKRIPRRGEVGLSADEISKFEDLGYVMSGSRHQRMNAIRIRKENQVYSAEDKRALAMYNFEEKAKREGKVMTDLKRLVQRTIGQDVAPNHDPFGAKDEGDVEP